MNIRVDFSEITGRFLYRKYYDDIYEAHTKGEESELIADVYADGHHIGRHPGKKKKDVFIEIEPGVWKQEK